MDFRLQNGSPKVTIIQKLNHIVVVIGPKSGMKKEFTGEDALTNAKHHISKHNWEINVSHIHAGQPRSD